MAVNWQKVQIPLVGGLNKVQDSKILAPPDLEICKNGVVDKQGTIRKRNGYDAVGTADSGGGSVSTKGRSLVSREDEVVLLHEEYLYTQDPVQNEWDRVGDFRPNSRSLPMSSPELAHICSKVVPCLAESEVGYLRLMY